MISPFSIPVETDKSKVALVALKAEKFPFIGESHGICAISGYLKKTFPEIKVSIFDLQVTALGVILKYIETEKPCLLGVSVKFQTFDQLLELHQLLCTHIHKARRP